MRLTTDKDYMDSRLDTISTHMLGEVRAVIAEMAGERKSFEAKMEGNVAMIRELLERRNAESAASLHKSINETLKWLVGIVLAIATLSLAYLTFLINNATPKAAPPAPAPIVIYAQPQPLAAPAPSRP
jgi:hypothetical protein